MAYSGRSAKRALADYASNGGAILYEDGVYSVDLYQMLDDSMRAYQTAMSLREMGLETEAIGALMGDLARKEVTIEVHEWANEEARSGFVNMLDTLPVKEPLPVMESMIVGYKYYISTAYTMPEMLIEHAKAAMIMNGVGSYYAIRIDGRTVDYFFDLVENHKDLH